MLTFANRKLKIPNKHFDVVSVMSFGWYDVAMWDNVKSTLKQRISALKFTTSNNVESTLCILTLIWTTTLDNVEFGNDDQRGNIIVKMKIFKKKKRKKNPNKMNSKFHSLLHFTPHFKRNMLKNTCKARKIKIMKDFALQELNLNRLTS